MRKRGIIITVVVIAAAAVAAWFGYRWFKDHFGTASEEEAVFVQRVSAVNSAGEGAVNRYSGVIENQKTEKVTFDSSRTLDELFVEVGGWVQEGDKLFSYSTESVSIDIQQKELEIERLNTTISNDNEQITKLTAEMEKAASADKVEFSAQILELQAEIAQTQYDIRTTQAEIEKMKASIENCEVYAPMTGTVIFIADSTEAIQGGSPYDDPSGDSDAFIKILADGQYRVKAKISEQTIAEIYEGERVIVRSRVNADDVWGGTVSVIDTQPETNTTDMYYGSGEGASDYDFYIDLDSVDGLMLGQHVIVEPDLGQDQLPEGIYLSSGWLVTEDGSTWCWASSSADGRLEKRTVETGEYIEDLDVWEIKGGLAKTDYLAWPDDSCREGAPVTTSQTIETGPGVTQEMHPETDINTDMGMYEADIDTDMGMYETNVNTDMGTFETNVNTDLGTFETVTDSGRG